MIQEVKIFYSTGTGNSYRVARWCLEKAETVPIRSGIEQMEGAQLILPGKNHLLG